MATYKHVARDERDNDESKIIEWWLECVPGEIRLMARGHDGLTQSVAGISDGTLKIWVLDKETDVAKSLVLDKRRRIACRPIGG